MKEDFELLDELYEEFCNNEELMTLLGSPRTPNQKNERVRRKICPLEYATADKVNFISMYFSSGTLTENPYVLRGYLCVDYFTRNQEDLKKIRAIVHKVMEEHYIFRCSFYDVASDTKGVYRYADRFRPLCWA